MKIPVKYCIIGIIAVAVFFSTLSVLIWHFIIQGREEPIVIAGFSFGPVDRETYLKNRPKKINITYVNKHEKDIPADKCNLFSRDVLQNFGYENITINNGMVRAVNDGNTIAIGCFRKSNIIPISMYSEYLYRNIANRPHIIDDIVSSIYDRVKRLEVKYNYSYFAFESEYRNDNIDCDSIYNKIFTNRLYPVQHSSEKVIDKNHKFFKINAMDILYICTEKFVYLIGSSRKNNARDIRKTLKELLNSALY